MPHYAGESRASRAQEELHALRLAKEFRLDGVHMMPSRVLIAHRHMFPPRLAARKTLASVRLRGSASQCNQGVHVIYDRFEHSIHRWGRLPAQTTTATQSIEATVHEPVVLQSARQSKLDAIDATRAHINHRAA